MPSKSDRAYLVITHLRNGYTLNDAAKKAGVAPSTVALWRRTGREDYENEKQTWQARFWRDSEDARLWASSMIENTLYGDALLSPAAAVKWLEAFAPEGYSEAVAEIRAKRSKELVERLNNESRATTGAL